MSTTIWKKEPVAHVAETISRRATGAEEIALHECAGDEESWRNLVKEIRKRNGRLEITLENAEVGEELAKALAREGAAELSLTMRHSHFEARVQAGALEVNVKAAHTNAMIEKLTTPLMAKLKGLSVKHVNWTERLVDNVLKIIEATPTKLQRLRLDTMVMDKEQAVRLTQALQKRRELTLTTRLVFGDELEIPPGIRHEEEDPYKE